jgi:hypothetical protein
MYQNPSTEFHAFTIKYNGRSDRITTAVKLTVGFDPDAPPDPLPPLLDSAALWDTGATRSVVTKATARALGLIPVGTALVTHAGGSSPSNAYIVNFYLPNGVVAPGVLVTECDDIAGDFGAIVGMDIMAHGDLAITNCNGQTCMSFRIPSMSTIDYVDDHRRAKFSGAPRNGPCPCGSGKKFKHCHGKA